LPIFFTVTLIYFACTGFVRSNSSGTICFSSLAPAFLLSVVPASVKFFQSARCLRQKKTKMMINAAARPRDLKLPQYIVYMNYSFILFYPLLIKRCT
jgi:hypothetical protein